MNAHLKNIKTAGIPLLEASKVLIMIHGRGASAESILSLSQHLPVEDFALLAPQATTNSWYPYSFMAPVSQNQPSLNSALELVDDTIQTALTAGISTENIYFLGFSQGACLTSEYASRHARQYGGLILFTGGLIGENLVCENYKGDFKNTPVLLTTGDNDPHVPVSRVEETEAIMKGLGANVMKKIYSGRPHTILQEEIDLANKIFS